MIVHILTNQCEVGKGKPGSEHPPKDHLIKRAKSEKKLRTADQQREDHGEYYQRNLLTEWVLQGLILIHGT